MSVDRGPRRRARSVAGAVAVAVGTAVLLAAPASRSPRISATRGARVIAAPSPRVPAAAARVVRRFLVLYARAYAGDTPSAAPLRALAAAPIVAALEQPPERTLRAGRVAALELADAGERVVARAELQFDGARLAVSLAAAHVGRRWLVTAFEPG